MSWQEFFLMIKGDLKIREKKYIEQATFTREIAYQIYCSIPLKKGKRHVSKKQYWELPFDKEIDDKETSLLMNAMDDLKKKINGSRN